MTDPAPTPTDTVECPSSLRPHTAIRFCWVCGGGRGKPARRVPTEIASAYRLGGILAVWDVVAAHPEDYPSLLTHLSMVLPPNLQGEK